ncbi:stage II sporulation protein R [Alicyclobacillus fastidiosus]|uniref:Stage II sporulation protein R n=1 Tax=Alicyclobacillus fastidiosus TaxID=392011 RepID=A0ABV5AFF8_9BACL|nr:stage II sporulation protein R [Alicyclobacillus fastidiosus]WEH09615.1 stage II sporulation protein R [Alicyclobacillus fastidiosus]
MRISRRFVAFVGIAAVVIGAGRLFMHQPVSAEAKDVVYSNVATPHDAPIPKEALRLRIIANSDSTADQTLKLEIRDAVVEQVGGWVSGAKNATEARKIVIAHIPQIEATATRVEHAHGVNEPIRTDVGEVPFPTKIYGNRVYPAGNYEALRITIGKGQGANWWCVLYPPLCFIDVAEGDAVPNTGSFPDLPPLETIQVAGADGKKQTVQVRMASVDYGESALKALKQLLNK